MKNTKPNIILIVIDALRARNLGCYGFTNNPSPNIDELSKQGILFDNTYSCWNTTDQSLTSIFTGKYPRSHGIMNHGDKISMEERRTLSDTNTKMIAQILNESGYYTMAVDWMGRWHKKGFDYYGYEIARHGLDKVRHQTVVLPKLYVKYMLGHLPILRLYSPMRKFSLKDMGKGIKDVLSTFAFTFNLAKLQDAAFVTQVGNELIKQRQDDSFFLFLHYWDTHTPYHCPSDFLDRNNPIDDEKSLLTAKYQGAVSYVDFQLGKLFNTLKSHDLWNNTMLIITSDHGDSLTEHDIFFDHHGLYDETTHVPLFIHYPDQFETGKRIDGFVQHTDLVPTICEICGIDYQPEQFDGQSLMPLITNEANQIRDHVFMEESYVQKKSALRTERYKYIRAIDNDGWCNYCQKIHVGKEELYDLKVDPYEMNDVSEKNRSVAEEMRYRLETMISTLNQKREKAIEQHSNESDRASEEYDPEEEKNIKKRLKDLGYLS